MRHALIAAAIGMTASCAAPIMLADPVRHETARLEQYYGVIAVRAGTYADETGFTFNILYANVADELGQPTDVVWTVKFADYCRNRTSWVQSVVIGPSGDAWYGYRVMVPAGPTRDQDWSSGGNDAEQFGGPATPGLLEAVAQGGRFTLALEDDTGQRHNPIVIDTHTPAQREALFNALPLDDRQNRPESLIAVTREASAAARVARSCPDP